MRRSSSDRTSLRLVLMSKPKPKLDLEAAATFLEAMPLGRWTTYGDLAVAGGRSPSAAQGIVSWIRSKGHPMSYRVLNKRGEISPEWVQAAPGLPATPSEVEARLSDEGVLFESGRAANAARWRA